MKKPLLALVSGGIVLAVVVASLILQPQDAPIDTNAPRTDVERSTPENSVALERRVAPVPAIAEQKEKSNAASVSIKPPVFHSAIDDRSGVYKKLWSPELSTYLLLTSVGALGDGEPVSADPVTRVRVSDNIKRQYGLSDEELAALVEYSSFVVRSDRQYQGQEAKKICDARTSYQSLSEFGNALNAFNNETEAHQEMLGRQAASKLPPLVFQKLNQQILNRPPKERHVADLSVLLVTDNRILEQEIVRFCDPQPEVLQE